MEAKEDINDILPRVAPELASKYAKHPLAREMWLDASVKTDEFVAFIPHPKDPNFPEPAMKEDYVWGPGPMGYGYYHLLTRASYKVLHARLSNKSSVGCCCVPQSREQSNLDEVKTIVYNRSIASRPDDLLAYKEALAYARGEAQLAYHVSQNIQLFVMVAT